MKTTSLLLSACIFGMAVVSTNAQISLIGAPLKECEMKLNNPQTGHHIKNAAVQRHINRATHNTEELVAYDDSVYYWSWSTDNNNWNAQADNKEVHFTYDSHGNLTDFYYEIWSGGMWTKSDNYIRAYDANNNET